MNKDQFKKSFSLNQKIDLADAFLDAIYMKYYCNCTSTSYSLTSLFNAAKPENVNNVLNGEPL